MRRALAALLLAILSFALGMPAFAHADAAKLPACCRQNGKHHCASPHAANTHGTGFETANRCAQYPHATAPATPHAFLIETGAAPSLRRQPFHPHATNAQAPADSAAAHPQRGPPSLS